MIYLGAAIISDLRLQLHYQPIDLRRQDAVVVGQAIDRVSPDFDGHLAVADEVKIKALLRGTARDHEEGVLRDGPMPSGAYNPCVCVFTKDCQSTTSPFARASRPRNCTTNMPRRDDFWAALNRVVAFHHPASYSGEVERIGAESIRMIKTRLA